MIEHATSVAAPLLGDSSRFIADLHAASRAREEAITLARQMVQLLKLVQRHRGMTMATLAGNDSFTLQIAALEGELERRLAYIQVLADSSPLLSTRDRENLHNAWMTLSSGWQDDNVIDNFELHSHVLEQLLNMLAGLSGRLEQPVSLTIDSAAVNVEDARRFSRQRDLLYFIAVQVPQMVEQIGRIRGLATYAISSNSCSQQHQLKLRYSIRRVREQSAALRQEVLKLTDMLGGELGTLAQLKGYEIKLTFLLNQVETEVLAHTAISVNGQQVFVLATDIIDAYYRVVDEGMNLVGQWHREDLDGWLSRKR